MFVILLEKLVLINSETSNLARDGFDVDANSMFL